MNRKFSYRRKFPLVACAVLFLLGGVASSARSADQLPPPAQKGISFGKDVRVILAHSCLKCHAGDKKKGGLSLASREDVLKGGKKSPGAVVGKSAESEIIRRVVSHDPDLVMPPEGEGKPLTADEVSVLRAWIDQGLKWDGLDPKSFDQNSILPRVVQAPPGEGNPVDRLLASYLQKHGVSQQVVSDEVFCRRAYLDAVGLLPTPKQLNAFLEDQRPDKRARLAASLLDDNVGYAAHWITFWQDLLRDGKKDLGTTDVFRPVTRWLHASLLGNKPYDQFVRELVNPAKLRALQNVTASGQQDDEQPKDPNDENPPADDSSGFVAGIQAGLEKRGDQQWEVQAVQNAGQVFLGVQLKCATCHDSFIDNWTMKDAWGLAGVYTEKPLEMIRCEIPTGATARPAFLFTAVGAVDASAPVPQRREQLASLITSPKNGRFARTVVNRLWGRLLGTPLVGTPDDMAQPAWHPDLLDFLANDLVENGYDLKRTIGLIVTSKAYQMPAIDGAIGSDKPGYVFRGPLLRRMTAEQFMDGLSVLLERDKAAAATPPKKEAKPKPATTKPAATKPATAKVAATKPAATKPAAATAPAAPPAPDQWRVWRENGTRLLEVLGRPDRRTVTTGRDAKSSTMQALELINGPALYSLLYGGTVPEDEQQVFADQGAMRKAATQPAKGATTKANAKTAAPKPATEALAKLSTSEVVDRVVVHALSRQPTAKEREVFAGIVGERPTPESVADLLWVVAMLPEFQLIR